MSLLVKILPHTLPVFLRKRILAKLFTATADAFACQPPEVRHLSYEECLRTYAEFTSEQAEKTFRDGRSIEAVKMRLFQNAYPLGAKLGKWVKVHSMAEVLELGQILYRAIGVEIEGDRLGNVSVRQCFFSRFYSARGCDLISALDDGIFSGLSGGHGIMFSERLTEGKPYCKAKLLYAEKATR